jgi:hypothetical protein
MAAREERRASSLGGGRWIMGRDARGFFIKEYSWKGKRTTYFHDAQVKKLLKSGIDAI